MEASLQITYLLIRPNLNFYLNLMLFCFILLIFNLAFKTYLSTLTESIGVGELFASVYILFVCPQHNHHHHHH